VPWEPELTYSHFALQVIPCPQSYPGSPEHRQLQAVGATGISSSTKAATATNGAARMLLRLGIGPVVRTRHDLTPRDRSAGPP
jgi:hypothetical protein